MQAGQAAASEIRSEDRMPFRIAGRIVLASLVESRDVFLRDVSIGWAKLQVGPTVGERFSVPLAEEFLDRLLLPGVSISV